jgi:hypothetical protein
MAKILFLPHTQVLVPSAGPYLVLILHIGPSVTRDEHIYLVSSLFFLLAMYSQNEK